MDNRLVKMTKAESFQGSILLDARVGRAASISDLDEQRLRELNLGNNFNDPSSHDEEE